MQAFTIRKTHPSDSAAIAEVLRTTWLSTYPNEQYGISRVEIGAINFERPVVHTQTRQSWVAEKDERIVGVCGALKNDEKAWVRMLYVLPEYQSEGIGSALLSYALEWAEHMIVHVNVASYNEKAKRFYLKHGFVEAEEIIPSKVAMLPSGQVIPEITLVKQRPR